jgi:hypothetical protein
MNIPPPRPPSRFCLKELWSAYTTAIRPVTETAQECKENTQITNNKWKHIEKR